MAQQQADTDKAWRAAAAGHMQIDKITFKSTADGMDIPAWVFQPLTIRGPKQHAGDRVDSREHPRASLRALHPVHP